MTWSRGTKPRPMAQVAHRTRRVHDWIIKDGVYRGTPSDVDSWRELNTHSGIISHTALQDYTTSGFASLHTTTTTTTIRFEDAFCHSIWRQGYKAMKAQSHWRLPFRSYKASYSIQSLLRIRSRLTTTQGNAKLQWKDGTPLYAIQAIRLIS